MSHIRKRLKADSPGLTSNDVNILSVLVYHIMSTDDCCSFKTGRRDKQQRTMPEISLPFYLESKSFLRSFPFPTNKSSLKCGGKLYFPKVATPSYLSQPTCSFYNVMGTSPTERSYSLPSNLKGGLVIVLTNRVQQK